MKQLINTTIIAHYVLRNVFTYHSTIKVKPVDAKSSTYIDFASTEIIMKIKKMYKENNNEDPKFEFSDNVRISKYKNIFSNVYTPNQSEEVFVIKKN